MNIFKKKDKKPRIAYIEQRNGTRRYYVEVWSYYGFGWGWMQVSKETEDLEEAKKMSKEIYDKDIVASGIL